MENLSPNSKTGRIGMVGLLVGLFVVSRLILRLAGVSVDDQPLRTFYQVVDPKLLREDLWNSLFYLHSQPPLFNLFVGAVLKLFPGHENLAFSLALMAMSLLCCLATLALMRGVGVGRPLAVMFAAGMMLCPTQILYENFVFYDLPVILLLVLAAVALTRFTATRRHGWLAVFGLLLTGLCLTRSFYHLVYLVGLLGCFLLFCKPYRRVMTAAMLLALVLTSTLYFKNHAVFGRFTASTWLGMTLVEPTFIYVPAEQRRSLQEQGVLSELALTWPFTALDKLPATFQDVTPAADVPVLTELYKSTHGPDSKAPNFHHAAYMEVADRCFEDWWALLRHRPSMLPRIILRACYHYVRPGSEENHLERNRRELGWYHGTWNVLVNGYLPLPFKGVHNEARVFLAMAFWVVFALGWAAWQLVPRPADPARDDEKDRLDPGRRLVMWFMFATTAYTTAVSILLQAGENFRYRSYVGPFLLTFLAMATQRWLTRKLAMMEVAPPPVEEPGADGS